jgi:hypothetical protein
MCGRGPRRRPCDEPTLGCAWRSLVRADPNGQGLPGLATSWQRINPLTWRFQLRSGASFHNGTPLTPEAVVIALRYVSSVAAPPRAINGVGLQAAAEGPDAVRVSTTNPDPILPLRLSRAARNTTVRCLTGAGAGRQHHLRNRGRLSPAARPRACSTGDAEGLRRSVAGTPHGIGQLTSRANAVANASRSGSPAARACLLNSCWGARHWSGLDRMCCGPTGVIGELVLGSSGPSKIIGG